MWASSNAADERTPKRKRRRLDIAQLTASRLRVRPKAITLTMFARLCMADLFIHGIGGGRYDRVTGAVIQETFGCPPPPYVVATATLLLPLLGQGRSAEDVRAIDNLPLCFALRHEVVQGRAVEEQLPAGGFFLGGERVGRTILRRD